MRQARKLVGETLAIGVLVVGLTAIGTGLYWLIQAWQWQTWDDDVNEAQPPAAEALKEQHSQATDKTLRSTSQLGPLTLAEGDLISHDHPTAGKVKVVEMPDGSRVLRMENLNTSSTSGQDVRVWVTDAPVKPGEAGARVFDDGAYVSLGDLKSNQGNQDYKLPANLDLDRYTSVSIWCDTFAVSFGAAPLTSA